MFKVKVSHNFKNWNMLRQSPGRSGRWGDFQFYFNQPVEECDFWIIHEKLGGEESTTCPPGNVFFVAVDPPALGNYRADFLSQFSLVVAPHTGLGHPNVLHTQGATPWFVGQQFKYGTLVEGGNDYDELKNLVSPPPKTALLSTITSNYNVLPGHKKRNEFVHRLKEALGDELAFFGRGTNHLPDKWDGLAPYKYHLAIENSRIAEYWSEKLADPWLAWSHPIYYGCPNIMDYFPAGALTIIDIDNFEEALATIRATIHSDRYEQSLPDMQKARELVLDHYNFFPAMARLCAEQAAAGEKRLVTLKPEADFLNAAEQPALAAETANNLKGDPKLTKTNDLGQQEYINELIGSALRSEEYAKSLEKELEKTRQEYARLEAAYRQHLADSAKLEQSYAEAAETIQRLEGALKATATAPPAKAWSFRGLRK